MAAPRSRKPAARRTVKDASRAAARAAILDAAESVFATSGFDGAKIADIARESGVATGTLYNYFENKDEIYRSLLELRGQGFLEHLSAVLERKSKPLVCVRELVYATFEYLGEHRATYAVFIELGGTSESSIQRIGGGAAAAQYEEYVALFRVELARAVRARLLAKSVDVDFLTGYLTGAMNGVIRSWLAADDGTSLHEHTDAVFELFVNGAARS